MLLERLKFVQRGVARRDIVPGLTHFRIKDGRVTGFNGSYSLSAPVDISFNAAPNAERFVRALDSCEDVISLTLDGNKLRVRSGDFHTAIPCVDLSDVPETIPEGVTVPPHGSILTALESLKPFVGVDASRPWATGVLFARQSAFATNNVVVCEYWLGADFPHTVNVPSGIIDEVVRVDEELSLMQIAGGSITFHYADGRWIKSQLLALNWPNILHVLDSAWQGANMRPIPQGLAAAGEKLARQGDKRENRIYLRGTDVAADKEGETRVEIVGVPDRGCYNTRYFNDMLKVATLTDFHKYPDAVPFIGDRIRGAIVGMYEK